MKILMNERNVTCLQPTYYRPTCLASDNDVGLCRFRSDVEGGMFNRQANQSTMI